jgi:AraC family transcriptional regulator of adaptative response/methylated-DNA-[protein]-cysteine methyltransferase
MTNALPQDIKLKAFYDRDTTYAGLFFVAVRTTGIFCRVGCPARAPKPENISFYETVKEALDAGYRPCKLCKPLTSIGETPVAIRELLDEIHRDGSLRLRDSELEKRGIQPEAMRRWFKKNHGMTFQAYQRYIKIGKAVSQLKSGARVTDVAFESYDSLSGFQESFKNTLGVSPKASVGQAVIFITRIATPLGLMMIGAFDEKLCLLEFCDRRMLHTELDQLQKLFKGVLMTAHCPLFDQVKQQMDEYFAGTRKEFDLPLHFAGTPFQQQVWQALMTIPYGKTRSYIAQARSIHKPEAVRAVARANGMNRISIIIPCHRVIGEDGSLTGYGGGLERKQWLLNHEARFSTSQQPLL